MTVRQKRMYHKPVKMGNDKPSEGATLL